MTASAILGILLPVGPTLVALLACVALERRYPAPVAGSGRADRLQNLKVWATSLVVQLVLSPALGGLTTLAVNAAGGGAFALPASGPGLVLGVVVYLLAMDLGEYLFHRAQHAIPVLWEMHSLHHSDPALDATTTVRHFWLDPALKTVTIWLAVGLLFKAPPAIVLVYMALTFYNFLTHANLRLGFGRASWIWNSPQYHRLHHAAAAQYHDCNYAALLPVFDLLSGAYRRPAPDEFPATGLDDGAEPQSYVEAAAWPLRSFRPWRRAALVGNPRRAPSQPAG
jgi:sterol desaturase/sphingolipid hydroxylase (fatty acid hydroxylase superfamily)